VFLARWHEPGLALPEHGVAAETLPAASVAAVGRALFTDFVLPFEIVSLVLLVAIVGAVVVARRKPAS
jgi:NADH-quinone oxidoreductase subunit J